ncbi:MAG: tetratricopeptide repeat protein [Planctomycetales bacterium]|nr:tetratricopeptide repeat protein [Planctomycetales bacterium]
MINRGTFDRLEDAIDNFEETWAGQSPATIEDVLTEYGLSNDVEAIVELIRIDIELRYERGLAIDLDDYLNRFGVLHDRPECVAEIAFEDYRSRSANGHPVSATRWSGLPGVNRELWFQELARESTGTHSLVRVARSGNDSGLDAAFEFALEESGFHLVHQIGQGAFSQVYLANQSDLANRFVVLKIVSESLSEPEYMALLQHTNIVPIYSFHRILSRSVICMPYTGCVTLDDFLKSKTDVSKRGGESLVRTVRDRIDDTRISPNDLPIASTSPAGEPMLPAADDGAAMRPLESCGSLGCGELAIWIFQRLSGALAHAHARGVLHNDLKPSNVLIRNDGEPALLDFNLSQTIGRTTLRHAGGTLPYMSPETYRAMMGQQIRPSAQSDLYGLGVMLFEFVTGRLPYPTPASIAEIDLSIAIDARRNPPLWKQEDDVAPGLKSIIDRCLCFDAAERYRSADDLHVDLQREQQNLRLVNTSEPTMWRMRKWVRRHPRAITSGFVAALLMLILIPLGYELMSSLTDNRVLRSAASYNSFSAASAEFLSSMMADPNRQKDSNIRSGVAILEQYDLLDQQGIERILSSQPADQHDLVCETIIRHLSHLAILESQYLSELRFTAPDASSDFRRLDRLIDAIKFVEDGKPARSTLFLESERARLAQNDARHQMLEKRALETTAESDSELYLEAVRLLSKYDHEGAQKLLAALADRNSVPSALRWTMLGRAQYADRKLEDAKLSFTQSIARAPSSAKLRVLKGRCHFDLGQFANAEKDYRKAIELDPKSVGAWSQLAFLLFAKERYDEAIECFNRSLELAPGRIWTLLKRSQTYEKLGRKDLADADFRAAMEVQCDDSNELRYRALARTKIDPEAALEDLRQAHRLNPDRPIYLHDSARILAVELHDDQRAIEFYNQALAIQPKNEFTLVRRALSYVRLNQNADALEDLKVAMQEPNDAKNLYQAACVHALIGREKNRQRAVTLLAQAIHKGYVPKDLDNDPDLESIRGLDEFHVISKFVDATHGNQRVKPNQSVEDADDVITEPSPL